MINSNYALSHHIVYYQVWLSSVRISVLANIARAKYQHQTIGKKSHHRSCNRKKQYTYDYDFFSTVLLSNQYFKLK